MYQNETDCLSTEFTYILLCVVRECEILLNKYVDKSTLIMIMKGKYIDDTNMWKKLSCYGALSMINDFDIRTTIATAINSKYISLFKDHDNKTCRFKCTSNGITFANRYEIEIDNYI